MSAWVSLLLHTRFPWHLCAGWYEIGKTEARTMGAHAFVARGSWSSKGELVGVVAQAAVAREGEGRARRLGSGGVQDGVNEVARRAPSLGMRRNRAS